MPPAFGLPHAFSGQTGYWYWGPPEAAQTVIAVGFERSFLEHVFEDVHLAARLDNRLQVDDDEQRAPVWICSQPRDTWHELWPRFRDT